MIFANVNDMNMSGPFGKTRGRGRRTGPQPRANQDVPYEVVRIAMEAFQRFAEDMRRPRASTQEERATTALKEFRRLNPPSFSGVEDPTAAKNWITQVGRMFNTLAIACDLKVTLATYQLEENAYNGGKSRTRPETANL